MIKRILGVLLTAATLTGCAIGPGPVVDDRLAERVGPGYAERANLPPGRSDRLPASQEDVVNAFLAASAAPTQEQRHAIMRTYLEPGDSWTPAPDVKVVRLVDQGAQVINGTESTVTIVVDHIGALNDSGQLIPSEEGRKSYTYQVVNIGSPEDWRLRQPPRETLLNEEALARYYQPRPIHFYSGDTLVPEWRYVSTTLSLEQQSDRLVNWLYDGPSAWLANVVERPPAATRPGVTQIVRKDNDLVVDLSAPADAAQFSRLAAQLAKTLVVAPITALQIRVNGQPVERVLPPQDPVAATPQRYAVVDGKLRRLLPGGGASADVLVPPAESVNVTVAAFAHQQRRVAVVYQEAGGQQLSIGTAAGLQEVTGLDGRMSRISHLHWLERADRTLLFLADGDIYETGPDGKADLKYLAGDITSMSVAPDGRRLALVIDGELRLATRNVDGAISVGLAYRVPTMFDSVRAAAFSDIGRLVVAGVDASGLRIARMNLDGTQQTLYSDKWPADYTIRHLVSGPFGGTLFELQGDAWDLQQDGSKRLADGFARTTEALPKVTAPSFEG